MQAREAGAINRIVCNQSRVGLRLPGAGAIIKLERDQRIEALITAAGIWMVSAVGMSVGMGMEIIALATTLIGLAVVNTIPRIMRNEER